MWLFLYRVKNDTIMEQYDHFAYGLELTKKMKFFQEKVDKSYYQAPNSDTLASISNRLSDIGYPVLVAIDGKDSTFSDNDAEQLIKKPQFFFMLLKPANNYNPQDILDAQAECEANCFQIQALMIAHRRKYQKGLTGLLSGSFTLASIGPIGDNLYGMIMGFQLEAGINYAINLDYWVTES